MQLLEEVSFSFRLASPSSLWVTSFLSAVPLELPRHLMPESETDWHIIHHMSMSEIRTRHNRHSCRTGLKSSNWQSTTTVVATHSFNSSSS